MGSLLARLRSVVPVRALTQSEALRVAELQANLLIKELEISEAPIPETVVAEFPRVHVQRLSPIPVSASAQWAKGRWHIVLNGAEPLVRQRFSLAHEFKHVLDAPFIDFIYPEARGVNQHDRAEQVADFFAACLLMPRMWVKRAWGTGTQQLPTLARRFGVSQAAMRVRLLQTGLVEPPPRCYGRGRTRKVAA